MLSGDTHDTPQTLRDWLEQQAHSLDEQVTMWGQAESRWSLARLGTFILLVVAWIPLREIAPAALAVIAGSLVLFAWSIVRHRRAATQHTLLQRRKMIVDESLRRAGGAVAAVRSTSRPADTTIARGRLGHILPVGDAWPLTDQERDDLDLYAEPTGIYGLLNRTSTQVGSVRLRDVLESPLLQTDSILARQQAVRWLATHHRQRLDLLAALAGLRNLDGQMATLEEAIASSRRVLPAPLSWLLRGYSIFMLMLAVYAGLAVLEGQYGPGIWLGLLMALNVAIWLPMWNKVRHLLLLYQRSLDAAVEYVSVARQAVADLPADTPLGDLRGILHAACRRHSLPAALQWVSWSAGGGFGQVLLDLLAFLDLHVVEGAVRNIVPHRDPLLQGLAAIGELEALLSLACLAAEQPNTCWPEPRDAGAHGQPHLSIRRGAHPLIEPAHAVPNDVALGDEPSLWIITGSNMSGKSTLLRMVGVNVLLSQVGGPAVAEAMTFSPLRLISDLRVRDSLGKGESYFLAEVRHLRRMIVPPAGDVPVLGLVDEPYRGTNHREQRAATLAIIEHLVQSRGLFLVATHDSTVTRLADGKRAENRHFQEQLGPRELVFDYILRKGPATTRNALRVLEREQYPADLIARAIAHADAQQDL